jgi:hypothetical protein
LTSQILVCSKKQNDIDFWRKIAEREGYLFKTSGIFNEIAKMLENKPSGLILWDAECEDLRGLDQIFLKWGLASQVLVVTDGPARALPQLFLRPAFSHYLYRRYSGNADFLCSHLVKKSIAGATSNFDDYFSGTLVRKNFKLSHSSQKHEVVSNFFQTMVDHRIETRIAHLGADAVDELLMNAIFDAPNDQQGIRYRRKTERDAEFELKGKEEIEAELIISSDLIGIRVVDQFGSFEAASAISCMGKNFEINGYELWQPDPGARLGLPKLIQSAASLIFQIEPGVRTESIALFNNAHNFRELRTSFSFFSVQTNQKTNSA